MPAGAGTYTVDGARDWRQESSVGAMCLCMMREVRWSAMRGLGITDVQIEARASSGRGACMR